MRENGKIMSVKEKEKYIIMKISVYMMVIGKKMHLMEMELNIMIIIEDMKVILEMD